MTNHAVGQAAEKRAAKHLESLGFHIRELNWKTRYCEIDIVVERDKVIYFVEVKYRQNTKYGYGSDYITPKKLKQMRLAAEFWIHDQGWRGACQLAVVSIDGEHITFIDEL